MIYKCKWCLRNATQYINGAHYCNNCVPEQDLQEQFDQDSSERQQQMDEQEAWEEREKDK